MMSLSPSSSPSPSPSSFSISSSSNSDSDVSTSEEKYSCPICGRTYATRSKLRSHIANKQKTCQKSNHQKKKHHRHCKVHLKGRCPCLFCEKQFHTNYALNEHQMKDHMEDLEVAYFLAKLAAEKIKKKQKSPESAPITVKVFQTPPTSPRQVQKRGFRIEDLLK